MNALQRITDNLESIHEVLDYYRDQLADYSSHLDLKGKTLRAANVEQSAWLAFYDERKIELKSMVKYLEVKLNQAKGSKWKKWTEDYRLDLSSTDKSKYLEKDSDIVEFEVLILEVKEVYDKYSMVVDAFVARGYSLKNLTELYVNSLSDVTI